MTISFMFLWVNLAEFADPFKSCKYKIESNCDITQHEVGTILEEEEEMEKTDK